MADETESGARRALAPTGSPSARAARVDALYLAVLAIVSLLTIALIVAFSSQSGLHARTVGTITVARNVRNDAMAIVQALADLEAARRAAAVSRRHPGQSGADAAKADALAHVAALERSSAGEPDLARRAARVRAVITEDFALDAGAPTIQTLQRSDTLRAELRAAIDDLLAGVNTLNDAARDAEGKTRAGLDRIAIALGLLALVGSALAIFALRREREQWRLAHAAAEEARAAAAASDLAKSRFLAVASHDMRQPLHALTLYLSALERRVEGAEARDILTKMDRATQSMVGMFSMLLDLARVQAGVVTPELSNAPLQDIIDRIVAGAASGKVDAAPTALAVRTDPLLLERMLSNLIANALKHGGGKARIGARAEGGAAINEVADDGPGIPLEDQERIFEEFVRLESRGDGLGLGLAIVKRIARLLNIAVELDSAPGRGTRFRLRLPLAAAPDAPGESPEAEQTLQGTPVLVMDDDPLAREAMAATLRDLGAEVRACGDAEAVAAALDSGFQPRLLLLDLRIDGDLRGIDVANSACVRLGPAARAIIVTGDTGPEALAALRASGHAFLIKPVDPRDLSAAAAAQLKLSST